MSRKQIFSKMTDEKLVSVMKKLARLEGVSIDSCGWFNTDAISSALSDCMDEAGTRGLLP